MDMRENKLIPCLFSGQLLQVDDAFRRGVLGRQCVVGRYEMHLNKVCYYICLQNTDFEELSLRILSLEQRLQCQS